MIFHWHQWKWQTRFALLQEMSLASFCQSRAESVSTLRPLISSSMFLQQPVVNHIVIWSPPLSRFRQMIISSWVQVGVASTCGRGAAAEEASRTSRLLIPRRRPRMKLLHSRPTGSPCSARMPRDPQGTHLNCRFSPVTWIIAALHKHILFLSFVWHI